MAGSVYPSKLNLQGCSLYIFIKAFHSTCRAVSRQSLSVGSYGGSPLLTPPLFYSENKKKESRTQVRYSNHIPLTRVINLSSLYWEPVGI
jgi:hypothetical protein